jgi:hypothetical protein
LFDFNPNHAKSALGNLSHVLYWTNANIRARFEKLNRRSGLETKALTKSGRYGDLTLACHVACQDFTHI